MTESKLKRIGNHLQNRPKDARMTMSSTIDVQLTKMKENNDQNGMTDFLLKTIPFIKKYSNVQEKDDDNHDQQQQQNVTSFINKTGVTQKGKIYKEFMETCMNIVVDDGISSNTQTQMKCLHCKGDMLYIVAEAQLVCVDCGITEYYQDFGLNMYTNSASSNGEIIVQFPYKRINHFREWLSQVQGRENTSIPENVIVAVMKELKKERVSDESQITHARIKRYLKKNGFSKYYEHVPTIMNRICRRNCVSISYETEQLLIEKFYEIQECFEKYRPKKRKNFMSYSYTLHKLCELIGRKDLVVLFPLLKSRSKLRVQDEIWEKICNEKGWEFIRSV
jgi:Poxvirus Late Transcription Factor VLTF3 like